MTKQNWSAYPQLKMHESHESQGQVHRPERVNQCTCPYDPLDYGSWNMNTVDRFSSKGRDIYVSVTYTLPYGKKTDSPDASYQSTINSAILKPFR